MWFYKIDGVLDGFTFPEDRGTRSRAAQEFQSKQTLFSKKLQGKCYITVSQIKGGRITLAAVSLESYNILARCREFLREAEVPVKNYTTCSIWRNFSTIFTIFKNFCYRSERPWGSKRRRQPSCFVKTHLTRNWSASTKVPCNW